MLLCQTELINFKVYNALHHIHSNKCTERLKISNFGGRLFVSIFVARIDPMMDDFGHFRLIPSHIDLRYSTCKLHE